MNILFVLWVIFNTIICNIRYICTNNNSGPIHKNIPKNGTLKSTIIILAWFSAILSDRCLFDIFPFSILLVFFMYMRNGQIVSLPYFQSVICEYLVFFNWTGLRQIIVKLNLLLILTIEQKKSQYLPSSWLTYLIFTPVLRVLGIFYNSWMFNYLL